MSLPTHTLTLLGEAASAREKRRGFLDGDLDSLVFTMGRRLGCGPNLLACSFSHWSCLAFCFCLTHSGENGGKGSGWWRSTKVTEPLLLSLLMLRESSFFLPVGLVCYRNTGGSSLVTASNAPRILTHVVQRGHCLRPARKVACGEWSGTSHK